MADFGVLYTMACTLRDHLKALRRQEAGSVSVEQVIITAGLVAVTVAALAALKAGIDKYAAKI